MYRPIVCKYVTENLDVNILLLLQYQRLSNKEDTSAKEGTDGDIEMSTMSTDDQPNRTGPGPAFNIINNRDQ